MSSALDLALQDELRAAHTQFLNSDDFDFLPLWQTLQERIREDHASLSLDTLELAQAISTAILQSANSLIQVAYRGEADVAALRENVRFLDLQESDEEDWSFDDDGDEPPEVDWEALRDWFLAHLAYPYPTPSQCRRLVKECHIDQEELENWFERMRELTHWDNLFSAWAQGDLNLMKQLMKLTQKEIDFSIPEHRCRTSSIQRSELERLNKTVHEVYKPGPGAWWADIEALLDGSDTDNDDGFSDDEENLWPPDDDDDCQELVTLEPDHDLDAFFDAAERSLTASGHPSISNPITTATPIVSKGSLAQPISAFQQEGLEWLEKLERAEAEADAAYAEVERIAVKLEIGGDDTVAVKLEAAEVRFEEVQAKEKELAIAALQRMQGLQAQVKREAFAAAQHTELVVKEEYVEAAIPSEVNDKHPVKTEVVEEVDPPIAKIEMKAEPDKPNSEVPPLEVKKESSIKTIVDPLVKSEPCVNVKIEVKTESEADTSAMVKTDPDTEIKVKEEPNFKTEVNSEPFLITKVDPDEKFEAQEVAVKVRDESNVKLEITDDLPIRLLSPNPDPATVVIGTFQPLDPEEIQGLIAPFAPLEVTIIQLDPGAIVVPSGLINLFNPDLCAVDEHEEEPEVIVKAEPVEVGLNDEQVPIPISFSLEDAILPSTSSSMFPQVQIVLDPSTPAGRVSDSPTSPPVSTTPRRTRGLPRRTSPRLAALPQTPLRFSSVSSISSVSGSVSGSSACSSDLEFGDSTTPISSPIVKHSRPPPLTRRTKGPPPQVSPTSPNQRKRKRGREEEPSPYGPSNQPASRPMKRRRGLKRNPEEEEVHAALCAEFVPPPLPKVSMVSESRKMKRKRREEEEEELRVIKRARVLCHVNATQGDSLERPGHSMAALVLDPTLAPRPSPKLEKVSGLPVVKSAYMSLEEIEKKLRVAVEDGPHPIDIVEEIKNLSLEALALMTDQEFSALICSPESWELKYLEYEPNDDLFEDPPTPPPEPTKVLLAPPSPPMSAVVALPPAEGVYPGVQPEAEKAVEPCSTAPTEEIVVKQEPVEPILGLALAPVLPSIVETIVEATPERIPDAPSLAAPVSDARDGNGCEAPSLTGNSPSTRPRSPKPTPAPLVRRTRIKRAVGMMDTLSLSGERVTPLLKDPFDLFKEVEEEDWRVEREQYYFPSRSHKNDGRRVPRVREFEGAWMPFMDYRQNVRYHPYGGGQRENSGRDTQQ